MSERGIGIYEVKEAERLVLDYQNVPSAGFNLQRPESGATVSKGSTEALSVASAPCQYLR